MADIATDFYPKANPNAFLDTANAYVGLTSGATQAKQQRLDLVKSQVDYLANGLGALASKGDLSAEDMLGFGRRAVDEGILDPNTFAVEMQQVQATGGDPAKLRALATQFQLRALDAGQKFSAQFGTPQVVDTGNALMPVSASALTGIHPMGEPIPKTLSPTELAAPAQVVRDGVVTSGTTGQALIAAGVNPLTAMPDAPLPAPNPLVAGAETTAPVAPTAPAPGASGYVVKPGDSLRTIAADAGTTVEAIKAANPDITDSTILKVGDTLAVPGGAAPVVPGAPTTPTFSPVTAGALEGQQEVGRASGATLAADLAKARTFQQAITPLAKAIPALEALGSTGTGPGTEQINEIQSFLQSIGVPLVDAERVKNFDEARKYLTQFAMTSGDAGTNDKLAAAFAGNPSTNVSNAAAIDVAKTAMALARLQNAGALSYQGPDSGYLDYAANFNSSQDPRAYGFDLMKPEARVKLIEGLSGPEKAKFVQSLRTAVSLGLVAPPG